MHISWFNKSAPWTGALCVVSMLSLTAAHAELISQDSAFGVDTITFDTDTNLQWLDVDLTANRSFDDIAGQLGPGGEFEGFRHATVDEIMTLWVNAGIPDILTGEGPPTGDDFTAENLDPVLALVDLIGITLSNPVLTLSEGFSADAPPGDPALRIVGELNVCISVPICTGQGITPNTALASLGPNQDATDIESNLVGHFLVQEGPVFTLSQAAPAIAGQINTWTTTNGTPSRRHFLFFGQVIGSSTVNVGACVNVTIDLGNARQIANGVADGSGSAAISRNVPIGAAGKNLNFQSLDLGTCETSNVQATMFN